MDRRGAGATTAAFYRGAGAGEHPDVKSTADERNAAAVRNADTGATQRLDTTLLMSSSLDLT